MVLLHYRVVPGLGATPSPLPASRTADAAVPVPNPVSTADADAAPATRADREEPCGCPGVTLAA